jgi:hypothetical protein
MQEVTTAIAMVIAMEAGATFTVTAGFAYDPSDLALGQVAWALQGRLSRVDVDLLAVRREGSTLIACIDESRAELPLSPGDFHRVVREIAWENLHEVWDGRFTAASEHALVAPEPATAMAAALECVA